MRRRGGPGPSRARWRRRRRRRRPQCAGLANLTGWCALLAMRNDFLSLFPLSLCELALAADIPPPHHHSSHSPSIALPPSLTSLLSSLFSPSPNLSVVLSICIFLFRSSSLRLSLSIISLRSLFSSHFPPCLRILSCPLGLSHTLGFLSRLASSPSSLIYHLYRHLLSFIIHIPSAFALIRPSSRLSLTYFPLYLFPCSDCPICINIYMYLMYIIEHAHDGMLSLFTHLPCNSFTPLSLVAHKI
jgi:hypothetical protein